MGQHGYGYDVEAVRGVVKAVSRNVIMGGADDSLLLAKTNGILGGVGVLAGFDFDEDQNVAFPGNYVDFAGFGAIAGSHDAVADGAYVVDSQEFASTAECEEAVK